jgi:serine/threonine protein kinase
VDGWALSANLAAMNSDDVRLLQLLASQGAITSPQAERCLAELKASEKAAQQVRAAQLLLRQKLVASGEIMAAMQQLRDVASRSGTSQVVGDETLGAMGDVVIQGTHVEPGELLGGFRLQREIARGGMGILFEAYDPNQRRFAIKVLAAQAAENPRVVDRFRQEADLAATLDHENIVKVHGGGFDRDAYFIVMDYFEGRSMAELIGAGRLTPKKSIEVVGTVAGACAYMHQCGVIHRDIKPGNILVGKKGRVCLTDFGLAKDTVRFDQELTMLGKAIGTPAYMSPEQARGDSTAIGPWTDVYGMGAVLFRALTGRYPFACKSFMATVSAIATQVAPRVSSARPDVPPVLDELIARTMGLEAKARPSASVLAQAIERLLKEVPISMPPAPPNEAV